MNKTTTLIDRITGYNKGKPSAWRGMRLAKTAVLLCCLSLSFNNALLAQDRYVAPAGVDAGDCSMPGSPCSTINYAINQAVAGDLIEVAAGTYNQNVVIDKSVTLAGVGNPTLAGSYAPGSPLGTVFIAANTSNVEVRGFTILGYDSPAPGLEEAAFYVAGNQTNIVVRNNTITAAGETGFLEEFGGTINGLILDNNIFNGQTFTGPEPAGCGFGMQFTLNNVPRQLVTIGNNDTGVEFTNNTISGVTGGTSSDPSCTVNGQGNNLVTIDAPGAIITGNSFTGTTARFAVLLRTRGDANQISGNTFDNSNTVGNATAFQLLGSTTLTGGNPDNLVDLFAANTYTPGVPAAVPSGSNTTIASSPAVTLGISAPADVDCGQAVTASVTTEDFTDLGTLQFSVNWDPALLDYVSFDASGLPGSGAVVGVDAVAGTLTVSWFDDDFMTFGKTLADGSAILTITFNALGSTGSTNILLTDNPTVRGASDSNFDPVTVLYNPADAAVNLSPVDISINSFGSGNPFSEVCVGDTAVFLASPAANMAPGVASYAWSFSGSPDQVPGAGAAGSGQLATDGTPRRIGAVWAATGTYNVDLMVTFPNGCESTAPTHTITVNAPDDPIGPVVKEFCEDETAAAPRRLDVQGLADPDLISVWTIGANPAGYAPGTEFTPGNGDANLFLSNTTRRSIRVEGPAPVGTYEFCVKIRNTATGCESAEVCGFSITKNALPSDAFRPAGTSVVFPFTADLDYDADHFICGGEEATYGTAANTAGINTVSWSISGGGAILEGENARNVKVQWNDPGTHTLTFVVTNVATGCMSTNSLQVTVDGDAPVIVCEDITVFLDANGEYTMANDEAVVSITDDCPYVGPFTVGGPTARMFDCDDAGQTFSRTVVATDGAGNQGSCTYNVTVEDNMAPVITCQDITVFLDTAGMVTIANDDALLTISDNCGFNGPFTSGGPTARMFDCDDAGQTFSRTMVSTDPSGNQGSCTYNVTVEDNMAPVITCQDITVFLDTAGMVTIANDDALLTISDNCGFNGPFTVGGPTFRMFDCAAADSTFSRTMVSTDPSGNQGSCTYNVTVEDNIAPTPPAAPAAEVYQCADDVPAPGVLTATDNCGPITVTGVDTDNGGSGCAGDPLFITRTWTFDDGNGNAVSVSQIITVEDDTKPIFQKANVPDATFMTSANATCPTTADISLVADQANPIATGNAAFSFTVHGISVDGPTVYTDNCTDAANLELYVWNIIEDFEGPATNCERKIRVIYRVYDACGNFQQRQQTFTIVNDVVPTAMAPADETYQCVTEVPKPEESLLTFTTGCAGASDIAAMDADNGGAGCTSDPLIITRTWTFDDGCGNVGSATQTITVIDTIAPVVTCPGNMSMDTDAGECTWTSPAGSLTPTMVNDNCSMTTVTWTVELPAGTIAPTPTPMAIATWDFEDAAKRATNLPYTADGGNAANLNIASVDLVGASSTGFTQGSGGSGSSAASANTWTAAGDNYWQATLSTDGFENLSFSSAQRSSNTGPRNFEVEYSLDGAVWAAVPGSSVATANNFTTGVLNDVALPSACDDQATLFLRWRNVDNVAVNGGTVASAGTNRIDDIVVIGQAITIGGGGMTLSGTDDASGTAFPVGTSIVTYEVSDACGNTTTCSFNVTVTDNEAPTIECPATQQVVLDDACEAVLPDYTGLATANDNCGVESVEQSPVAGTVVSGTGTETVILTVTDVNGNTASCTFMVDKLDQTPPTLVCLTNTVFLNPDGEYTLVDTDVLDFDNSFDNCSAITVNGISPDFFTCDDLDETFTVLVTAEDASGNSATCNAIITIDQGTALPAPWQETTLGTGTGDAIYQPCDNGGEFTLTSNTRLFPMDTDNYEYVYQELCGEVTITAQITQFAPNGWQGLFIRNAGPSNTAGVAYRVQGNTTTMPSTLGQAHLRQTDGGTLELSQFSTIAQPYWVRIVSTPYIPGGRIVQLFASPNGTNWALAQSRIVTGLNDCVEVGLILQSQDLNTTVEAKFANVEATGTAPTPLQGPNGPTVQQQPTVRTAEIFPNPAASYVTLSFSHPLDADAPYILRNQMGQAVLRGTLNAGEFSTELNVANLAAGMYSIEVLTGRSEREVLRFIKQ